MEKYETLPQATIWNSSRVRTVQWTHSDRLAILLLEDILEFSRLQEVRSMRLLVEILRGRVGSPLSWSSIGGDLQLSPNTVKKYAVILEALHIVFLVRPYHRNIARAIQKMPKLYFYDTGYVDGDEGIKIENTTAVCLRKHTDLLSDTTGKATELQYVRTREKQKIDFAVTMEGSVSSLIEVKKFRSADSASIEASWKNSIRRKVPACKKSEAGVRY